MYRTRNAACLEGHRGFESHPLRHLPDGKLLKTASFLLPGRGHRDRAVGDAPGLAVTGVGRGASPGRIAGY